MRGMFKHALFCALVAMVAAVAPAQGLVVEDDLTTGSTTTIRYDNPKKANATVTVTITPVGGAFPEVQLVIQLDARGKGQVDWEVLDWFAARFNIEGEPEQLREISAGTP